MTRLVMLRMMGRRSLRRLLDRLLRPAAPLRHYGFA